MAEARSARSDGGDQASPPAGHPQPYGLLQTLGMSIVAYGVYLLAFMFLSFWIVVYPRVADPESPTIRLEESIVDYGLAMTGALALACALGTVLVLLFCFARPGFGIADYLAMKAIDAKTLLVWLGAVALFLAVIYSLSFAIGIENKPSIYEWLLEQSEIVAPIFLVLVVVLPLFEEVLFRGFLYKGLAASRIGVAGAILVSAALWTVAPALHGGKNFVVVFLLGLLLGVARAKSGSIFVTLALHSAFVFVALTAALLTV